MIYESYDYKRYKVLFVDDEDLTRKYFERNFRDSFDILTAAGGEEARTLLRKHQNEIGILITDQRMPGESGVQLLEYARKNYPRMLRMMITAYADLQDTVDAINSGAIYKYVSKPYEDFELELTLKRAMEFHIIHVDRDQLLHEKLSSLHRSVMTERIVNMGVLSAGLSHHLRNSLTAVKSFLDLAPQKLSEEDVDINQIKNPDYWNQLYDVAQGQVSKVVDFLHGIECYVTVRDPEFSDEVEVKEVVSRAIELHKDLLKEHKISMDISGVKEGLKITANAKLLSQALEWLVEERAKHLAGDCEIRIRSEVKEGETEQVVLYLDDPAADLDEEALAQLFDPFRINPKNPSEFGIHLLGTFFLIYHHGGMMQIKQKGINGGIEFQIGLPMDANQPVELPDDDEFLQKVFNLERLWEEHLIFS
ncbi:MAG: response regulator [Verrucomicrobiota bacterium]